MRVIGTPRACPIVLLFLLSAPLAWAQGHAAVVHFTTARSWDLRGEIRLPGTVESPKTALVAAEVAGKVIAVTVHEGDRVSTGQVLARQRVRWYQLQLDEARSRLDESQARLKLAERRLARAKELFSSNVVSQEDLDDATSEQTAWLGREAQNRAQIEQLELAVELLQVRAPFDGVVTRKHTEVGAWLDVGGAVVEIVSLSRLEVGVDLPERYYSGVQRGTAVRVTFDALPDLALDGKVVRIVPQANRDARTFPIKISIRDEDTHVAVGMLATVTLPLGSSAKTTIVPKDAVVRTTTGEVVYRLTGDDATEAIPVTSGEGVGEWVAVHGEIRPGDRVITRGNERLIRGQPVDAQLHEYPEP